jgi:hypothetical protein
MSVSQVLAVVVLAEEVALFHRFAVALRGVEASGKGNLRGK